MQAVRITTMSFGVLALMFLFVLVNPTVVVAGKCYSLPTDPVWPTSQEINAFASQIVGGVTIKGDAGYQVPFTYNLRTQSPKPAFVVTPANEDDIAHALTFVRTHHIRVAVMSTGHHQDVRNTVDNSLLLDMSRFNQKSIDLVAKTITVGPGQPFGDIHTFVYAQTSGLLVAMSGADPGVGPAGWVLGGGHGRLTRLHGLGVDALLGVTMILYNGSQVNVSAQNHAELFRALKGGGGSSFGVLTSLTFRLFPDPGPFVTFNGIYPPTSAVANGFQAWMAAAPNSAGAYYILAIDSQGRPYVNMAAHCFGTLSNCSAIFTALTAIPDCIAISSDYCVIRQSYNSYSEFLLATYNSSDHGGSAAIYLVSGALNFTTADQLDAATAFVRDYTPIEWGGAVVGCSGNAILGGASAELDPQGNLTAVAPGMRQAVMAISCYVAWEASAPASFQLEMVKRSDYWADTVFRPLSVGGWVYWNEPQHNFKSDDDWQTRYWGSAANYARLREVKRMYDPDMVFTCYHCIGWEDVQSLDPAVCPTNSSCSNTRPAGAVCDFDVSADGNTAVVVVAVGVAVVVALFVFALMR